MSRKFLNELSSWKSAAGCVNPLKYVEPSQSAFRYDGRASHVAELEGKAASGRVRVATFRVALTQGLRRSWRSMAAAGEWPKIGVLQTGKIGGFFCHASPVPGRS